jgi:endonuclease/exonuclease/phosphatase family metal-dependent hydrolase
MAPDILGLQEVDTRHHREGALDQLDFLAKATGMNPVAGPTLARSVGHYGNGMLTRFPVIAIRKLDLSVPGREPRGALDVDLDVDGTPFRVIVTHFGLRATERRAQVQSLLKVLSKDQDHPVAVLGDFNEWSIKGPVVRMLDSVLGASAAVPSYPSWWPVWSLDRIWVRPRRVVDSCRPHATIASRLASDHLPIVASIKLPSR